jgi:two-component system chemotaxis response regulator CheY
MSYRWKAPGLRLDAATQARFGRNFDQLSAQPRREVDDSFRRAMKKILVIDDSPTVRQQVGLALSQAGFQVVEAVDGVDAIAKVDASVAMLICDVNMPRMNGLEMLEKLRTDARWKTLPVVMLTTEGQPGLIERAKKAGAKGWIIKPFKAELLVAAVQRLTA